VPDALLALWNAWEIRSMILVSLFLQVFLFVFAGMRRRSSWRLLRILLWLAYLSANSVAMYMLGHLATRASEPDHQLVSFWAPFLLTLVARIASPPSPSRTTSYGCDTC